MDYVLVAPEEERVEQFNSFWEFKENVEWNVKLFDGRESIDIREYIKEKEFVKWKDDDKEIRDLVSKKDLVAFLSKINASYHTRLNISELTDALKWDDLEHGTLDQFVQSCRNKTKKTGYSFATKVFSFISNGKDYPIMDSYVVTLLDYYLRVKGKKTSRSSWGNYTNFKAAYDLFIDEYGLKQFSYKQADIFLWTYGTAIRRYWEKNGVLSFSSVQYKP